MTNDNFKKIGLIKFILFDNDHFTYVISTQNGVVHH